MSASILTLFPLGATYDRTSVGAAALAHNTIATPAPK